MEHRINRRRINHFCTKVAKLHCLNKGEVVDDVCRLDYARVSCHKSINIGPNLKLTRIEGSGNDGSGIVATATAQIGDVARNMVGRNKSRHDSDFSLEIFECFKNQAIGKVNIENMFVELAFSLYKIPRVEVCSIVDNSAYNDRR